MALESYSPMLDEKTGCRLLKRVFEAHGLAPRESFPLHSEGLAITLDGFDPQARIGYEYITTEAGDRLELTPDVIAELERRMEGGALYVLLIDELDVLDEDGLTEAAGRFLEEVQRRRA